MSIARQLVAASVGAMLAGCAFAPLMQQTDLGGDTHAVTVRSGYFARRSTVLKVDAEQAALAYCASRRLALVNIDTRLVDPDPPEFSTATVTFRCVPI